MQMRSSGNMEHRTAGVDGGGFFREGVSLEDRIDTAVILDSASSSGLLLRKSCFECFRTMAALTGEMFISSTKSGLEGNAAAEPGDCGRVLLGSSSVATAQLCGLGRLLVPSSVDDMAVSMFLSMAGVVFKRRPRCNCSLRKKEINGSRNVSSIILVPSRGREPRLILVLILAG